MRLFTGISLDPNVIEKLSAALAGLRPTARINWTSVENLHITLKFIGEWPETRLPKLTDALEDVRFPGPIPLTVSGCGFFAYSQHPHSLFADLRSAPQLGELAVTIDRTLTHLGCPREKRPYRPHITLARIKPSHEIGGLRDYLGTPLDTDFGSFEAANFHLYLSTPGEHGSIYTKLATYDLMRE